MKMIRRLWAGTGIEFPCSSSWSGNNLLSVKQGMRWSTINGFAMSISWSHRSNWSQSWTQGSRWSRRSWLRVLSTPIHLIPFSEPALTRPWNVVWLSREMK